MREFIIYTFSDPRLSWVSEWVPPQKHRNRDQKSHNSETPKASNTFQEDFCKTRPFLAIKALKLKID